jgi:hypothetical protein
VRRAKTVAAEKDLDEAESQFRHLSWSLLVGRPGLDPGTLGLKVGANRPLDVIASKWPVHVKVTRPANWSGYGGVWLFQ